MATWYEVWYSMCEIRPVQVSCESGKMITLHSEYTQFGETRSFDRKVHKEGRSHSYWPTREEAVSALVAYCSRSLEEAKQMVAVRKDLLQKALSM